MTKRAQSKGIEPIKAVTPGHFYAMDMSQFYYPAMRETLVELAVKSANRIVEAGKQDEARRLYLYSVGFNDWDNPQFHPMVMTAALLKENYDHQPGYPDSRKLKDAVINAVEFSYLKWIETDLLNKGMYKNLFPDQASVFQKVFYEHAENIGRANGWFRQKYSYPIAGLPEFNFGVGSAEITSPVPVSWMNIPLSALRKFQPRYRPSG